MARHIRLVLAVSRQRIRPDDVRRVDRDIDAIEIGDADGPMDGVEDAEVLVGNPTTARCAQLVSRMPRLRWFHAAAAGVDRYLPVLAARPDVAITNSSGANALPIAEFTIALIFAIVKRFATLRDAQVSRDWKAGRAGGELREVRGQTLCLVGLGAIGTEIARLATGCGMRVVGVRRQQRAHPGVAAVFPPARIVEAVAGADHVVVCCPLTPETHGLIDARVLAAMSPDAWLINVARGEVVAEDALFDALTRRAIAGAALDTLWVEPLPAASRWYTLDNVLITPHRAASSVTHDAEMLKVLAENLRRYRAGEPLENLIDRAAGY